ncbi:MAG: ATP-binding protein [Verrucomicrobiota bacterium]
MVRSVSESSADVASSNTNNAGFLSKVLATTLKAEAHPLAKAANDIAIYTAETISVARGLAKGLYPVELNRGGLLLALEDLAARTSRQFRIDCKVIQSGPEPHIEKSAEIHIYRIVQESISNAIRHGHAQCIVIETRATAGLHVFSVTDNGQGFEKSSAVSSGMGLHLMDYRARLIHAQLQVKTVGRGGCQVTCILKADEQPLQGSPVLGKPEVLAGV